MITVKKVSYDEDCALLYDLDTVKSIVLRYTRDIWTCTATQQLLVEGYCTVSRCTYNPEVTPQTPLRAHWACSNPQYWQKPYEPNNQAQNDSGRPLSPLCRLGVLSPPHHRVRRFPVSPSLHRSLLLMPLELHPVDPTEPMKCSD